MMTRLRVGVIGCGEAVQGIHLPALNSLPKRFTITACCDVNGGVLEDFSARTGARPYRDQFELIESADVDVVLVATPDSHHADVTIAACEAGKKAVLVEKPLTLNARIARDIARSSRNTGVPVLLSYPHVYDPAFVRARELWGPPGGLYSGEFRCIIGPNEKYTRDTIDTIRGGEVDMFNLLISQMDLGAVATEMMGMDIGVGDVVVYGIIMGLLIHDFPVMRRILGEPDDILYASARGTESMGMMPGLGIDIVFAYGSGRVLHQVEIQRIKSTDWGFDLRRDDLHVSVRYPTTFAPGAPSVCTLRREEEFMTVDESHGGCYENGFRRAWNHLYDVVTGGLAPETGVEDAVRDMELVETAAKVIVGSGAPGGRKA